MFLRDDQRRGQPNDVDVSRLGQKSLALEDAAQVPRSTTFCTLRLVNHDRVQESLSTNFLDPTSVGSDGFEVLETLTHLLTKSLGTVREVFVDDDFERSLGDSTSERVLHTRETGQCRCMETREEAGDTHSSVGGTVLSGKDLKEDLLATKDTRDGVDTSRESLSEENHVGLDLGVVLEAEKLSGTGETLETIPFCQSLQVGTRRLMREGSHGLDFVTDQEDVVLLAEGLNSLEVVLIGDNDTGEPSTRVSTETLPGGQ